MNIYLFLNYFWIYVLTKNSITFYMLMFVRKGYFIMSTYMFAMAYMICSFRMRIFLFQKRIMLK